MKMCTKPVSCLARQEDMEDEWKLSESLSYGDFIDTEYLVLHIKQRLLRQIREAVGSRQVPHEQWNQYLHANISVRGWS